MTICEHSKSGVEPQALAKGILILACLVLSACAQTPSQPPQSMLSCDYRALERSSRPPGPALAASAYGSVTDIPLDAVLVHDRALYRTVIVQSLYSQISASGTTMVTARFANCSDRRIQFRARTSFLDQYHAPIESTSAWSTVFIEPGALGVYQERSMRQDGVAYFLIEIGRAD